MTPLVALQAKHLACARAEQTLWQQLNFEVASGQLLQVVGANGAGKTTLLRVLTGIVRPLQGFVCWQGQPIQAQASYYREQLAYLGHQLALKNELTVAEQIRFSCGAAIEFASTHYIEICTRLRLQTLQQRLCRSLSQGQRQLVALAAILLSSKPLWILDEPFAALDAEIMQTVEHYLAQHLLQHGIIVLTTHRPLTLTALPKLQLMLGNLRKI